MPFNQVSKKVLSCAEEGGVDCGEADCGGVQVEADCCGGGQEPDCGGGQEADCVGGQVEIECGCCGGRYGVDCGGW